MNTMNRCSRFVTQTVLALTLLTPVLPWLPAAQAQTPVRQFPTTALRGLLEVTAPPQVLLNGQPARLSPGARIRNTHNMIVLSGALVRQPVMVNYVRDGQGLLHDVWILTPAEERVPRAGMENVTNLRFGSDAAPVLSGH